MAFYSWKERDMKMIKVPHLVQYQGSKRLLAPKIAQFFPQKIERLIEPFCGVGAISIYAAAHSLCNNFILNDINGPIVDMLEECINSPERLYREYKKIWSKQFLSGMDTVDYYYEMRELFNKGESIPALTLFILARVAKGAIRYNSSGDMNQICDKRRFGTKPETIKNNAVAMSSLLKGKVCLQNKDYKDILKESKPGDLIYMDPPYQGVARGLSSRYINSLPFDEFVESLDFLNQKHIDFIVSYDGKTGNKTFGKNLPESLGCKHLLIEAGRSSQATLNGKEAYTYESLYLSKNLMKG